MKDDPQDAEDFVWPNGHVIIDDLPHGVADDFLEDEIICGEYHGKSFAVAAIDAARRGDHGEAVRILMLCRESAGESDAIRETWERYMNLDEPICTSLDEPK